MRRKGWKIYEENLLLQNYKTTTIKELMKLFPGRTEDSINAKIKRLKGRKKIEGYRDVETKDRAMHQRRREI
jgi:alanine-alpha-ketoisovalerate/valine-pyruvate aminotransferase